MIDGLKSQGIETIEGLEGIIEHPVDTVIGIKGLLLEIKNNPELLAQIGSDIVEDIQGRIDKIADGTAYETGYELGRLTVEIAGTAAGVKLLSKIPGLGKFMEVVGNKGASKAKVGDIFGKMGTYIENPGTKIDWSQFAEHGWERMAQRGLTKEMLEDIVAQGKTLSQNNGAKYAFITPKGVVVVSKEGKLITAWGKDNFDSNMAEILGKLF